MQFCKRLPKLRAQQGRTQQELANSLAVRVSYISKVVNERLHFDDYPFKKFIHKLATELVANSNLPLEVQIEVNNDHRLADSEPLETYEYLDFK